jgi:hypothetical protein
MSKAHFLVPNGPLGDPMTVRLGSAANTGANLSGADEGKLVKLVGESQYDLCAAGDLIHGVILAVEVSTSAGWTIGGVLDEDMIYAVADGAQATPGTGTIAVGDFVVAGTITAKGTPLTSYPKVCKATVQLGDVPGSLAAAGAQALASLHAWQVVSLGPVGTGAVGTVIVLKPQN